MQYGLLLSILLGSVAAKLSRDASDHQRAGVVKNFEEAKAYRFVYGLRVYLGAKPDSRFRVASLEVRRA
jgi:hypothetical protein